MISQQSNGTLYFQFESFLAPDLFHGVFSRKGGVSPEPWQSLNLGGTVGDEPENVKQNLNRVLDASGFSGDQLVQVKQVHSAKVIKADLAGEALQEGDAITTNREGLLLLMRFADCVPVLFYDPVHQAIAIAHAGWKGTLKGVVAEVVRLMGGQFNSSPGEIIAGIGPSIGPDHYFIGHDVIEQTKSAFPKQYPQLLREEEDGVKLDLWKANELHLRKAGVEQIDTAGLCTGCDLEHWYSHRAEEGSTGRFAAVIGLRGKTSYG